MEEKIKTGIMGGTFNPIHVGHLMIAECAYEQCHLDRILFMPSKIPPHKSGANLASEEERMRMVELSIKNNPHFYLSTVELDRQGITYSVDTLRELVKNNTNESFYFILGADSLFDLPKWKNPEELLTMATVLVASRYGMEDKSLLEQIDKLKGTIGGEYELIKVPTIDISSSEIRRQVSRGNSIRYYVKDEVRDYICGQGLYLLNQGE